MSEKASRHSTEKERVTSVPIVPGKSEKIRRDGKDIGTITHDIKNGNTIDWVSGWPGLSTHVDLLEEIVEISHRLDGTVKPAEPEAEK